MCGTMAANFLNITFGDVLVTSMPKTIKTSLLLPKSDGKSRRVYTRTASTLLHLHQLLPTTAKHTTSHAAVYHQGSTMLIAAK